MRICLLIGLLALATCLALGCKSARSSAEPIFAPAPAVSSTPFPPR